jgi:hypothetical protein
MGFQRLIGPLKRIVEQIRLIAIIPPDEAWGKE